MDNSRTCHVYKIWTIIAPDNKEILHIQQWTITAVPATLHQSCLSCPAPHTLSHTNHCKTVYSSVCLPIFNSLLASLIFRSLVIFPLFSTEKKNNLQRTRAEILQNSSWRQVVLLFLRMVEVFFFISYREYKNKTFYKACGGRI